MPLLRWLRKLLPPLPPPVKTHLLHRWQGERAYCSECSGKDYDDVLHLHPNTRLITILDVMEAWARQSKAPRVPGSLLDLASSVFYVDERATVYMAEGWLGMVFVELSDRKLKNRVMHFAEQYKPADVMLVFVGVEDVWDDSTKRPSRS
jgi:hypothetical protein